MGADGGDRGGTCRANAGVCFDEDITDQSVLEDHPRGPGSDVLCDLMSASVEVFRNHPINAARKNAGKRPATNVGLWGLGQAPRLQPFADAYGPRGAMITAVDLLRGIAALLGWDRIEVPGATGYLDTDYAAGFWTNRANSGGARYRVKAGITADAFMARGAFGQYVVVIPSRRLVVARFGYAFDMRNDLDTLARVIAETIRTLPQS